MRFEPKKFELTKKTTIFLLVCVLGCVLGAIKEIRGFFIKGDYLESLGSSPLIGGFSLLFTGIMMIWASKWKSMKGKRERVFWFRFGFTAIFWGVGILMGVYLGYKVMGIVFLAIALLFSLLTLLPLIENFRLLFFRRKSG